MTAATPPGASKEPVREKAFPEPTPVEGQKTEHAQTVDEMSERFEAQREAELQEAMRNDPGLAARQAEAELLRAGPRRCLHRVLDETVKCQAAALARERKGADPQMASL